MLQTLADTLGQFARKSDYRFSGEAVTGEEAAAWRRALDITAGMSEGR